MTKTERSEATRHVRGEDEVRRLAYLSERTRYDIIDTLGVIGSGHPGPSLSIVEILVALYFNEMAVYPDAPKHTERDRFILSKGHGALGLYAVLSLAGFFARDELFTFECLGSRLQGHPDARLTPGVEVSTGSLGQGLSFAVGTAIAARLGSKAFRSYCLLGDGETQEGNVWEAAMTASKYRLDNLLAIVDWNGLQGGVTLEVMPSMEPYLAKWEAFGWHALDVPGHDLAALLAAMDTARATSGKPTVIVARTVKGHGVSYMENQVGWHSGTVEGENLATAFREIGARLQAFGEEVTA